MMKGQSNRHVPGAEPLPHVAAGVLAGSSVGRKRHGPRHAFDRVRQAAPVNDPVPGLLVPRDCDLRHSSLDILADGELSHRFAWLFGHMYDADRIVGILLVACAYPANGGEDFCEPPE